ncbi:hypothetical protein MTO96_024564 [Rhipicephalus appendiculatus]
MPLAQRLGKDFLLFGDVNAHHTAWGSHRCCPRCQALWNVSNQLGLSVLNTGAPNFMRRAARVLLSAIDVSLDTEGCHYTWTPLPDTWGSDHLPLLLNPIRGKTARSRVCHTVDWQGLPQALPERGRFRDVPTAGSRQCQNGHHPFHGPSGPASPRHREPAATSFSALGGMCRVAHHFT